jgi:hypothetical protein
MLAEETGPELGDASGIALMDRLGGISPTTVTERDVLPGPVFGVMLDRIWPTTAGSAGTPDQLGL